MSSTWRDIASTLRKDEIVYIQCDCGDGRPRGVSNTGTHLISWCYRCGESYSERKDRMYLEELRDMEKHTREFLTGEEVRLPKDFTYDIPAHAMVWLYTAGIDRVKARDFGIGWSAGMQRVILPVYDDSGKLVTVQSRAVDREPKYLSKGKCSYMHLRSQILSKQVCIVEDILSAIRVSKYIDTVAILGTVIHSTLLDKLSKSYHHLLVWTDADEAGNKAYTQVSKKADLFCLNCTRLVTTKDPKHLTDEEIQKTLEVVRC